MSDSWSYLGRTKMPPAKLISALQKCAATLASPKGVYVLHHACMFAEYLRGVQQIASHSNDMSVLADLLGMPSSVTPVAFHTEHEGPSDESVEEHIEWMFEKIPTEGNFPKQCRWIGFAAGAAARNGYVMKYPLADLVDSLDLPATIRIARNSKSPGYYLAHLVLGYMQGWLWADGQGSIDYFRRMNMPDDEPFKIEVNAS